MRVPLLFPPKFHVTKLQKKFVRKKFRIRLNFLGAKDEITNFPLQYFYCTLYNVQCTHTALLILVLFTYYWATHHIHHLLLTPADATRLYCPVCVEWLPDCRLHPPARSSAHWGARFIHTCILQFVTVMNSYCIFIFSSTTIHNVTCSIIWL